MVSKRILKVVSKDLFKGSFKELKESVKCVSMKFKNKVKGVSRRFCNLVIARHSLQLPEQKKGLFCLIRGPRITV